MNYTPLFGKEAVEFRELGEIDLNEYELTSAVSSVCVDTDTNLYLADMRASTIHVFGSALQQVRVIDGPGQGPKELESPWSIDVRDDRLYVYENHKGIKVLDGNGDYVDFFVPEKRGNFGVFRHFDNSFLGLQFYVDAAEMQTYNFVLARYEPDGTSPVPLVEFSLTGEDVWGVVPFFYLAVDARGRIYLPVEPADYRINRYSPDGTFQDAVSRKYKADFSEEFLADYAAVQAEFNLGNLPDRPPVVRHVCIDEYGLIWVSAGGNSRDCVNSFEVSTTLDVFSSEGEWLYTTKSPLFSDRFIIRHNRLYALTGIAEERILRVYKVEYPLLIDHNQ